MSNTNASITNASHCGLIAIVGKPNVGKSTLMNRVLGQKISITSRRPQTTRHRILGVLTNENQQMIFLDTPGMLRKSDHALHRSMNRAARSALLDVDLIVFVIEAGRWTDDDDWIASTIEKTKKPILLVINKVDKFPNKDELLPFIESIKTKVNAIGIVPLSAKTGSNVEAFSENIASHLPENTHLFPPEQLTDRSERFLASEIIREKIMRIMGQELPYAIAVEIESFETKKEILHIHGLIWVVKNSHKPMIIGKNGEKLKRIGTAARHDMERLFGNKVFLQLWVKIKSGWIDDERIVKDFGYDG